MYGVLISIKSFLKFLNSYVVSTTTIACQSGLPLRKRYLNHSYPGICQNHCMILYVYVGEVADAGGVLTFYIPMIVDDGP